MLSHLDITPQLIHLILNIRKNMRNIMILNKLHHLIRLLPPLIRRNNRKRNILLVQLTLKLPQTLKDKI